MDFVDTFKIAYYRMYLLQHRSSRYVGIKRVNLNACLCLALSMTKFPELVSTVHQQHDTTSHAIILGESKPLVDKHRLAHYVTNAKRPHNSISLVFLETSSQLVIQIQLFCVKH